MKLASLTSNTLEVCKMLKWKNISINDLSKEQLRQALAEAVSLSLTGKNTNSVNDLGYSFTVGIIVGSLTSIVGMLIVFAN